MPKNVVVVGGGLAGLAAAIYLARGGRSVTLFEKRRSLGGRAITNLRHGYRFNLGAHAFYRGGAGASVYRELGIPVPGNPPRPDGLALLGEDEYRMPMHWLSFLTTSLLSLGDKRELAGALWRVRRGTQPREATIGEWIDANLTRPRARQVFEALVRLATYSAEVRPMSAASALAQMRVSLRGVLYVHEGWQRIVDSLHSAAVAAGVNFVTSMRVVGIHHENGAVKGFELGGLEMDADRMDTQALAMPELHPEHVDGARIPAETVVLAVDPITASELTDQTQWQNAKPVTAACLDVALRSLPDPKRTFALGIDDPVYYSVHSAAAQLAPKGGALVQLIHYASNGNSEAKLESLLDRFQPGWQDVLVHRRFLPSMTVSNAAHVPSASRPSATTPIRGLYLAGDWVGDEGMLSDAALASARAASKAILAD